MALPTPDRGSRHFSIATPDWLSLLSKKIPRGFESFFPKPNSNKDDAIPKPNNNKDDAQPSNETRKDSKQPSDDSRAKATEEKEKDNGKGNGPNNDSNNDMPEINPIWVVVGGVVLMGLALANSGKDEGHQITFQDFKTSLLDSGSVIQLVVVNNKIVRVYTDSSHNNANTPNATAGQRKSSYFFSIGSVDSFERKLEDAQRELGVDPRDYVPVIYTTESSWVGEFGKLVPTLLIIGFWLYMMRSMSGGGGGNGQLKGMFSMGKAKMTVYKGDNKIKTTFKDVAGDVLPPPQQTPFQALTRQKWKSSSLLIFSNTQKDSKIWAPKYPKVL